jgi:exodeoxyribonuclease VII small subunit
VPDNTAQDDDSVTGSATDPTTATASASAAATAFALSSARPSYEQAREELADVVRRLETGGATLEESLVLWERGEALATICQEWLDGARARLVAAAKLDGPAQG